MVWTSPTLLLSVALVWISTFLLAWKLLARLLAISASRTYSWNDPRYWSLFVFYRLVILAPYAIFLIIGKGIPTTLQTVILSWVVFAALLSLVRFFGPAHASKALWWLYGYVYDGLLWLYPYQHLLSEVMLQADVQDGERVLDLGCGTGNFIARLHASSDIQVVGVDNSPTMLRVAAKKLRAQVATKRVTLVKKDLMQFLSEQPDDTFDKVVMVNVVYSVKDRQRLWVECLRVLKPTGKLTVTNSDRSGSGAIIAEHLKHRKWYTLLHPKLIAVGAIDYFISELAHSGLFSFASKTKLFDEISEAGGKSVYGGRLYGGSRDGVNIIFSAQAAR